MEHIKNAVLPLKAAAVARAAEFARKQIATYVEEMDAVAWDLDKIDAPCRVRSDKYKLFSVLSTWTQSSRRSGEPNTRKRSDVHEARFIAAAEEHAAILKELRAKARANGLVFKPAPVYNDGVQCWAFYRADGSHGSTETLKAWAWDLLNGHVWLDAALAGGVKA